MSRATTSAPTRRPKGPSAVLAIVACGGLVASLAGCSSGHHSARIGASVTTSTTLDPVPTTRLEPVSPGGAPGPVVTVPTESGTRPISPTVDLGQQIIIAPSEFEPHLLLATSGQSVTWTNLTTAPQRLTVISPVHLVSPSIPPGGKWSYTSKYGTNLHFQSSAGFTGSIQFNPA